MNTDRFVVVHPLPVMRMVEDRFAFQPKARFHWLQKALLWALAKLGCHAWDEVMTCHTFRPRGVLEAIREQQLAALDWGAREPLEMAIGSEDFEALMGLPEMRGPYAFDIMAKPGERTFHGMRVRVLPWIKGVVIYPARERYL